MVIRGVAWLAGSAALIGVASACLAFSGSGKPAQTDLLDLFIAVAVPMICFGGAAIGIVVGLSLVVIGLVRALSD